MKARAIFAAVALLCGSAALEADVPKGLETFDAVWTIVRDTHFDKSFNGVDWEAARTEFRPRAAAAQTPAELRKVLHSMLGRLGQSHFSVLPGSAAGAGAGGVPAGAATPGFDFRIVGGDVLVTEVEPGSGAATAGVRPGWQLVAIGGHPVADLLKGLQETPDDRLRSLEAWRALQARLRGPDGAELSAVFEDGTGAAVTKTMVRWQQPGQPVTVGNLPTMYVQVTNTKRQTPAGRPVGVIGFNVWMATIDRPFQLAIDEHRQASGIIIDLRGNPGGLAGMMMGIAGHFIPEPKSLGVMTTRDNELKFAVNPRFVNANGERVKVYDGPVAILVDGLSASASECFTGGMQALGRVRVFGERTIGAALPSQFDKLPNGDVFIHATADFVTADGTRLEGRGVIPEEVVPLRRQELLAGRDRALEAALAWIDSRQGLARE
ncbi:MAG TPA: S41 family peptidase [Vicinamibacterales bacterium]|nr:S41 family peptidase [Vicinamibacterales bacterium]